MVRLEGELDFGSVPRFDGAMATIASDERLFVDLRSLEFIDSAGLGALVRLHARMAAGGGTLSCVVLPQSMARRLFEVTGLDDLFGLVDTSPDDGSAAGGGP